MDDKHSFMVIFVWSSTFAASWAVLYADYHATTCCASRSGCFLLCSSVV